MLVLVWAAPLIGALFAFWRGAGWLTLLAPLPALAAAGLVPVGSAVSLPWLLLGVELGLDEIGRLFLLFSALLWLAASLYAAGGPRVGEGGAGRFRLFFLLAMAGNLGLIVARDMVSFYLGFTLMGLAAYGLVVQPGSQRARCAARRYLVWTIAGELVLFVALVLLAAQHGGNLAFSALASTPPGGWVVLLIVIGFGIKLALPGLHFWLPPAYAVTPAPAVAVLGGAMIKAGLLGWIRFLPPGDAALTGWGQALIAIGVTGIFFGALFGLMQSHARLVLGYSSISKMGVLTTGMGAALAWPAGAPLLIGALALYAAHHALVKGALFLGLGLAERGAHQRRARQIVPYRRAPGRGTSPGHGACGIGLREHAADGALPVADMEGACGHACPVPAGSGNGMAAAAGADRCRPVGACRRRTAGRECRTRGARCAPRVAFAADERTSAGTMRGTPAAQTAHGARTAPLRRHGRVQCAAGMG
jgi:formate hydrogenlyase subunit 3/multisubunit Na+/H+ antiporter MnhD subunit